MEGKREHISIPKLTSAEKILKKEARGIYSDKNVEIFDYSVHDAILHPPQEISRKNSWDLGLVTEDQKKLKTLKTLLKLPIE